MPTILTHLNFHLKTITEALIDSWANIDPPTWSIGSKKKENRGFLPPKTNKPQSGGLEDDVPFHFGVIFGWTSQ